MMEFTDDMTANGEVVETTLESWDTDLTTMFGLAGTFIRKGEYAKAPTTAVPDISGLAVEGLQYKATEKLYLEAVVAEGKSNRVLTEARVPMYGYMWAHTGDRLRAQVRRQEGFAAVEQAGDDPAGLVKILRIAMSVERRGDG